MSCLSSAFMMFMAMVEATQEGKIFRDARPYVQNDTDIRRNQHGLYYRWADGSRLSVMRLGGKDGKIRVAQQRCKSDPPIVAYVSTSLLV